jgi:CheY-like chemotaxis protein
MRAEDNMATQKTILVVDDEAPMRRAVMRFLAGAYMEYDAVEAENGAAALEKLSPDVALVICDVNMPALDGFAVCKTLRTDERYARYAELPVILLTGRDEEADLETSWEVGSTLHVTKPFDIEKLHRAVKSVLGH